MKYKLRVYNFSSKQSSEFFYDDFETLMKQVSIWKDRGHSYVSLTLSQFEPKPKEEKTKEIEVL